MLHHPAKRELMAYAEGMTARRVSARTARHLVRCKKCGGEVKAIRASLEFVATAPGLEPREGFAAAILNAARQERRKAQARVSRRRTLTTLAKGLACAAVVVVFAASSFHVALTPSATEYVAVATEAPLRMPTAGPSPEEVRRATTDIQTLAAAAHTRARTPQNLREWQQRRTVLALDADLNAALAALERNPGCDRAGRLVSANLQRQAQALKTLYVERTL